ncbi:MAG: PEP-CTERM sorting domain-containing protein [Armatimonadetes bacterium]|nr:PEP-CTERM sorting domain-containing protein [Armatimonadota bacterium]
MKNRSFLLTLIAVMLLAPGAARAQLLFSLNPAALTGGPGQTLTFNGTLTNTGTSPVYLNGLFLTGLTTDFTMDPSLFLNNTPPLLASGASITDDLFTVDCGPAPPVGDWVGSATVIGGADANAQDAVATQNFLVSIPPNVQTVPEPGTLSLLGLGLGGVVMAARRRRRA